MEYYKVLGENGKPINGGSGEWFLPKGKCPGKWMPIIKNIVPCERGYHLCRREDLVHWLGPTIWIVEGLGESIVDDNKVVFEQARLIRKIEAWNDRTARLFAADCAEQVLHIWEKEYPDNKASHNAITAARSYAKGEIDYKELSASWAAARSAARDAAGDAARSAAWAAARDAAWAAARAAARDAAWAAARAAAGAAARAAARDAARDWQTEKLFEYLEI